MSINSDRRGTRRQNLDVPHQNLGLSRYWRLFKLDLDIGEGRQGGIKTFDMGGTGLDGGYNPKRFSCDT